MAKRRENSKNGIKAKKVAITTLIVFIAFLLILAVETIFPRDVAAAKARIERAGYTDVEVSATRRHCGKNRKLFEFTGTNQKGAVKSGRFCFDLIRFSSTVTAE